MRLIDADRLKDKLVALKDYRQICEIIDNTPTVGMDEREEKVNLTAPAEDNI